MDLQGRNPVCKEKLSGQKVWHSTDKYRRVIFQCNNKFANEKKCETPTFIEEQFKAAFLASFNQFDKTSTIEDLELAIKVLNDNTKLEKN